jgi:hypothetical protein
MERYQSDGIWKCLGDAGFARLVYHLQFRAVQSPVRSKHFLPFFTILDLIVQKLR